MGGPEILLGVVGFSFMGAFAYLWGEHRKARAANDVVKENYTKLFRLYAFTAGLFILAAAFGKTGLAMIFGFPSFCLMFYCAWFTFAYATKKCEGCARRVPNMKMVASEAIGQQRVSKTVQRRIEHHSSNGNTTGHSTYDETVHGIRTSYHEQWACQDCNHISHRQTHDDNYNQAA